MNSILTIILILLQHVQTFTDRVDALAEAVYAAAPKDLTPSRATDHAIAAALAERPGVPAELLLGLAFVESHYKADARSKGGRYCGVIQATAKKYGYSCKQLYDLETGYRVGAESLERWMKACKRKKRWANKTRCMLYGYGGVSVNGSVTYPTRVLKQTKKIRRHLHADV